MAATLDSLEAKHEIIVVDGGSNDETEEIANARGVTFIHSDVKGRAAQMNLGARVATSNTLLFLHADTIVSHETIGNLISALSSNPNLSGGGFHRFFDSPSTFLKLTCLFANLRAHHFGIFLGDQGIFVRREVFVKNHGFNEAIPFGEDLDFSVRLKKFGQVIALSPAAITSARRFERLGPIRQTIKDLWLAFQILRFR